MKKEDHNTSPGSEEVFEMEMSSDDERNIQPIRYNLCTFGGDKLSHYRKLLSDNISTM